MFMCSLQWEICQVDIICCDLTLPIQAIIQAAFFSLVHLRSTVACSCFITRKRLHIHIDVCDKEGDYGVTFTIIDAVIKCDKH